MTTAPTTEPIGALLKGVGGDLSEPHLARLADAIARRPDLWRPLVHHDPLERYCASLYADDEIGIWVISWMPGHDTGYHDHSGSFGAVCVTEGRVHEDRPPWAQSASARDAAADEAFSFDDTDIHRVTAVGTEPAVTIHVYAPPLTEMGVYTVAGDGSVQRTVISWNQRLRG